MGKKNENYVHLKNFREIKVFCKKKTFGLTKFFHIKKFREINFRQKLRKTFLVLAIDFTNYLSKEWKFFVHYALTIRGNFGTTQTFWIRKFEVIDLTIFFPCFSGGSANISDDSSSNTSPLSALLCRNNTSPTGNSNNGGSNSFQNESSVDVGHGNFKRSASADTLGAFNSGGPSSSFISSSNMKGKIEC